MFRKVYITLVIIAIYFSGGIIPYYVVLRQLGLLNRFAVYIVPAMLNTFFVIVSISFFQAIPKSLHESAKIDDANDISIFFKIVFPLSAPLMATMALFAGVGQWNSWIDTAFFVQDRSLRTMMYLMMEVIQQSM